METSESAPSNPSSPNDPSEAFGAGRLAALEARVQTLETAFTQNAAVFQSVIEAMNVDIIVQKRVINDLVSTGRPYIADEGWNQIDYLRYYAEFELCTRVLPAIAALGRDLESEARNLVASEYDDGSTVIFG